MNSFSRETRTTATRPIASREHMRRENEPVPGPCTITLNLLLVDSAAFDGRFIFRKAALRPAFLQETLFAADFAEIIATGGLFVVCLFLYSFPA